MKRKVVSLIASFALLVGVASAVVLPAEQVYAVNVFEKSCGGSGQTTGGGTNSGTGGSSAGSSAVCGSQGDDLPTMIKSVVNVLLYIVAIIAVVAIIIGGIRYTTSNGDSSAIKAAKDTILYAVIGLVVAILSFAIVNFVIGRF